MPEGAPIRESDVVSMEVMTHKVQLFAAARETAQRDSADIVLPPGSTVADLRTALVDAIPELVSLAPSLLVAVDAVYADDSTVLTAASEIAVFPPVSGG